MVQKVKIIPRDYQENAVEAGMQYLQGPSNKPVLIVAPTASGKSLIISMLAHRWGKPCLVLQPSKELLVQNYNKLLDFGGEAEIFSASLQTKNVGEMTYATLGSIKDMARTFKLMGVKTVFIDESHASIPPEKGSMFMKFIKELEPTKVIGLTATPFRLVPSMEGSQLKLLTRMRPGYFREFIYVIQIWEIVSKGYWAKLVHEVYEFDERGLQLNTTGAEYTEDSVKRSIKEQKINNRIFSRIKKLQEEGRKGILVFMDCLENARTMVKHIPRSAYLGSDTKPKERDQIVKDFKAGIIQVICNFNILSVGFDYPELDTIILGSPTNSLSLLYQRIGRGTRIHPDKESCLIIDYCNNIKRFGRMETLVLENVEGFGWGVFNNDILLTNTPLGGVRKTKQEAIDEALGKKKSGDTIWFGVHKGKLLRDLPVAYMQFLLYNPKSTLKFDSPTMFQLKKKMEAILEEHMQRFSIPS